MDSKQQQQRRRKPRLDRRNAIKHIDYDAASSSSPDSSSSSLRTRSLDLPSSYAGQTSFRVEGIDEGEFERICRNLGLSGPEDFAIPAAAWEARKVRSSSDMSPITRLRQPDSGKSAVADALAQPLPLPKEEDLVAEFRLRVRISEELPPPPPPPAEEDDVVSEFRARVRIGEELPRENGFRAMPRSNRTKVESSTSGGIKGARPPVLAPPPSMSLPVLDKMCSTWDILRSLAPENAGSCGSSPIGNDGHDDDESEEVEGNGGAVVGEEEERGVRLGETDHLTGSSSFSTSNDDDSSSTTTEPLFVISPNGRFKLNISSWTRGGLLGSGSFGTVYEGLSE